ncbi:hypothetical protein Hypma_010627 [Hypsizygus marmoreus]|uniref:Uncharacterized protein n=1 Tax=Hypsizygus marmoreus TaxID=39966 RepID=A0A369JJA6_HYPMA|nr:hypothetical protein Hypma_010627 [Hypsizygus marmoreus]
MDIGFRFHVWFEPLPLGSLPTSDQNSEISGALSLLSRPHVIPSTYNPSEATIFLLLLTSAAPPIEMPLSLEADDALAEIISQTLASQVLTDSVLRTLVNCSTTSWTAPSNSLLDQVIRDKLTEEIRIVFPHAGHDAIEVLTNTLASDRVTRALLSKGRIDPKDLRLAYSRAYKGGAAEVQALVTSIYARILRVICEKTNKYMLEHRSRPHKPTVWVLMTPLTPISGPSLHSNPMPNAPVVKSRPDCISELLAVIPSVGLPEHIWGLLRETDSFHRELGDQWSSYEYSGRAYIEGILRLAIPQWRRSRSPQFASDMGKVLISREVLDKLEKTLPTPIHPGTLRVMFSDNMHQPELHPPRRPMIEKIFLPLIKPLEDIMSGDSQPPGPGKLRVPNPSEWHVNRIVTSKFEFAPDGEVIEHGTNRRSV